MSTSSPSPTSRRGRTRPRCSGAAFVAGEADDGRTADVSGCVFRPASIALRRARGRRHVPDRALRTACAAARHRDRPAARFRAALAAFGSAPALAQEVGVSIISTPANGAHYVAGETITTRLTMPQIQSGAIASARMKLNVGGVERQATSTSSYAYRPQRRRAGPRCARSSHAARSAASTALATVPWPCPGTASSAPCPPCPRPRSRTSPASGARTRCASSGPLRRSPTPRCLSRRPAPVPSSPAARWPWPRSSCDDPQPRPFRLISRRWWGCRLRGGADPAVAGDGAATRTRLRGEAPRLGPSDPPDRGRVQ